jgi:hypothetical protein
VQSYYTIIALDIANERAREAERRHLLDIARADDPAQQRSIRRSAGALVASVSRASGKLARRLDENANVSGALIGRSMAAPCTCADSHS